MSSAASRLELLLADESATGELAAALAERLEPGSRLHLSGDLGTGKTAFSRALIRTLGHTGRVRSPTFTLMEPYNLSRFDLYHFDFYRFSSKDDWRHAGFDEPLGSDAAVALVEWPEMAGEDLPLPDLHLAFGFVDGDGTDTRRRVRLQAWTPRGVSWLNAVNDLAANGRLAGVSFATD